MDVSREEFDRLEAIALANMHMMRGVLHILRTETELTEAKGNEVIDAILAGLDDVKTRKPILEGIFRQLETFRPSLALMP